MLSLYFNVERNYFMEISRIAKKKAKKKMPKWLRIVLSSILVILIGGGAYLYHMYNDVAKAVDKMNVPLAKKTPKVNFNNLDPISILMVGVDERKNDRGRTDSMLVITINPKTKTTNLLSIPRDTRTKLINTSKPSKDRMDKINAAYAYGGIQESIDTVENLINVPIDYYIKVNMEGFKDIVDAVGGIDVDNKYAFELDGTRLKTGPQHLNGTQALQYARMRHQDPKGDFGREERQREVISKIIQKGKSVSILTKYNDVLKALENNIQTNLTMDDIIGIQKSYKPAAENINSFQLQGTSTTINNIYYYKIDDEERQSVSDKLRESLGLSSDPVSKIYDNAAEQSTKQSTTSGTNSTSTSQSTTSKTNTTNNSSTTSSSSYQHSTTSSGSSTSTKTNTSSGATSGSSGSSGSGTTGAGGTTGSDTPGSGTSGDSGTTGSGTSGSGTSGSGTTGSGTSGSDTTGSDTTGTTSGTTN